MPQQTILTQVPRHALHAAFWMPLILWFLAFAPVRANIFYITDTSDTTNLTSLRGAIIAANALAGDNTIVLTNNLYSLTIPGANEDASFTGDLDVTNGNLTIIGLANTNVTILATNTGDRVFEIFSAAQLTLLNLTISGGNAAGYGGLFSDGEVGGGIYNMGDLVLENCIITNNSSGSGNFLEGNGGGTGGGDGGGIYNTGFLTMFDCVISKNSAGGGVDGAYGGGGGGIFNSGSCQFDNCKFIGNSGGDGGPPEGNAFGFAGSGGNGGGICNSAEMTLNNCAITGNQSGQGADGGQENGTLNGPAFGGPGSRGGAAAGIFNSGNLTITTCTIGGNVCGNGGNGYQGPNSPSGGGGGSGAGVYNVGSLQLYNSTLANNSCGNGGNGGDGIGSFYGPANGGAGGNGGTGGAIFTEGTVSLIACTVTRNSGGTGGPGANGDHGGAVFIEIDTNGNFIQTYFNAGIGFGGQGGSGGTGGIYNASTNSLAASINDALIAMNSAANGGVSGLTQTTNGPGSPVPPGTNGTPDLSGPFTSAGHNLIGQTNGSTGLTNQLDGDLVGSANSPINPLLGPLTNNGGSTATIMLLPCSPAIDAGDDTILNAPDNLTLDQRGQPRKSGAHVDIGAVEYNGLINGVLQPAILARPQPSAAGYQLTFNAATQHTYTVLASANLTDWFVLGPATETTPGYFSFQDTPATIYPQRFYQVRQP